MWNKNAKEGTVLELPINRHDKFKTTAINLAKHTNWENNAQIYVFIFFAGQ